MWTSSSLPIVCSRPGFVNYWTVVSFVRDRSLTTHVSGIRFCHLLGISRKQPYSGEQEKAVQEPSLDGECNLIKENEVSPSGSKLIVATRSKQCVTDLGCLLENRSGGRRNKEGEIRKRGQNKCGITNIVEWKLDEGYDEDWLKSSGYDWGAVMCEANFRSSEKSLQFKMWFAGEKLGCLLLVSCPFSNSRR